MEQNELDLTPNEVENNGEIDTVSGDNPERCSFAQRLPRLLIFARYLFQLLCVLALFVMSFF